MDKGHAFTESGESVVFFIQGAEGSSLSRPGEKSRQVSNIFTQFENWNIFTQLCNFQTDSDWSAGTDSDRDSELELDYTQCKFSQWKYLDSIVLYWRWSIFKDRNDYLVRKQTKSGGGAVLLNNGGAIPAVAHFIIWFPIPFPSPTIHNPQQPLPALRPDKRCCC